MSSFLLQLSAPCRSVRVVAATIGVELNLKITDLMAGEQLKPEYLKVSVAIWIHRTGFHGSLRYFTAH